MTATTLIGPLGNLLEVRCPAPSLAAPQPRASSETETLGGRRVVFRAPSSRRRWAWNLSRATPADVAALVALEQGVYGPPPWYWYDPVVAATNMLRPEVAVPGVGGAALSWSVVSGVTVALGGAVTEAGIPGGSVTSSVVATLTAAGSSSMRAPLVPVVAGRTYTASGWLSPSNVNGARVSLSWRSAADAELSVTDGALVTTKARASVSAAAPAGAAGVRLVVKAFNGSIGNTITASAFQLSEHASVQAWSPGEGMPRVVISGLDRAYQQAWGDGTVRTDYAAELVEVG